VVDGNLRWDDFSEGWRLTAKRILDLDQAREQYARRLVLSWPGNCNGDSRQLITAIERALGPSRGGQCSVAVSFARDDASATLQFGEEWCVRPTRDLVERLVQIVGRQGVKLYYAPRLDA